MISLVQLVAGIALLHQPCPAYQPLMVSCYDPPSRTIYLSPDSLMPRFTLAHEYGHAWDFERLNDASRARFQRLLGFPASTPWWGGGIGVDTVSPGERFADAYSACVLGRRTAWNLGRSKIKRICALLPRRAYLMQKAPVEA